VDVASLKNRSGDPQITHIRYPRRSYRRSLMSNAGQTCSGFFQFLKTENCQIRTCPPMVRRTVAQCTALPQKVDTPLIRCTMTPLKDPSERGTMWTKQTNADRSGAPESAGKDISCPSRGCGRGIALDDHAGAPQPLPSGPRPKISSNTPNLTPCFGIVRRIVLAVSARP